MVRKILKEEIIPVKGTTALWIGDPLYIGGKDEDKLIFHGNISSAPLGLMKIALVHIEYDDFGGGQYDEIEVTVWQASNPEKLKVYLSGQHYVDTIKKEMVLGCDAARFDIKTKFGMDRFDTYGDGDFGKIIQYKQYYGMKLTFSLTADCYAFDEVKERMLKLFRADKKNRELMLLASGNNE